jgi:hypothetical protein
MPFRGNALQEFRLQPALNRLQRSGTGPLDRFFLTRASGLLHENRPMLLRL